MRRTAAVLALLILLISCVRAVAQTDVAVISDYRKAGQAVLPISDTTVIAEAEEFHVEKPTESGWRAMKWGQNYYAATLANTFLSRKAFLGASEQASSVASINVRVPKAGKYLALVRYEAAPRFQTQFLLRVEQDGKVKLDRLYGARDNLKIWAFGQRLKAEAFWSWGAVENVVWEGHDTSVDLDQGDATLSLIADKQPEPAARRNIDLIMLTSDIEQVKRRIEKENYLPLDGMLTQAGDVYLKLHNHGAAMTLTVPHGIEHSPYWVHIRDWNEKQIRAAARENTDWFEVGSLLDSLNDGQWRLDAKGEGEAKPTYSLEFGVRDADGKITRIGTIADLKGNVELAYCADLRYSRRIRTTEQVLYDLLADLKKLPVHGVAPKRTLIYGYTFDPRPNNPKYNAAIDEFAQLIGATALNATRGEAKESGPLLRGYIDIRDQSPKQLEDTCRKLKLSGRAEKIAVVSLGDEIGLQSPGKQQWPAFLRWLKERNVNLSELGLEKATGEPPVLQWPPDGAKNPALFYYWELYRNRYGIARQKELTDTIRKYLPNANIGANFSPHHGHFYLGNVCQWVSLFREGGMTMPWTEDYAWQPPIGTQQMNCISLDLFRAGIKGKPGAKIQMYVMPHSPGNTPNMWRRQFYSAIAHGAKIFNLFEFRPVQAAYTENHVSSTGMYQAVRIGLHELGTFEDIVQDGNVRSAIAALWFSETGDIWDDNRAPFDAAKRCLYIAIRHAQIPLDVVVEQDALAGDLKNFKVLYLTDQHVSRAASKAIADWVNDGGSLFATAGAGMFDEFNRPNETMRALLGADEEKLEISPAPIRFEKQDLPFAKPVDQARVLGDERMPVFGAKSQFTIRPNGGARPLGRFASGGPAMSARSRGKGSVTYFGFLPGLTYFKPAIPRRPVDRGTTDDSMDHFVPTAFHPFAATLLNPAERILLRPITCSEPLVESTIIDSNHGIFIPLINWSGKPVKKLQVKLNFPAPPKITLASEGEVNVSGDTCTFDLDVADALILRP